MSNRRKTARRREDQRTGEMATARLFRRRCTDCNSTRLEWETGAQVMERDPALAASVTPDGCDPKYAAEAPVWTCLACGEAGMFLGLWASTPDL